MKKILACLLLSGCSQVPPIPEYQINQQPPELFIPPATPIITTQGVYVSGKSVEIWHSHKKYSDLQDEVSRFRPLTHSSK
jgi:hypothetical protein